MKQLLSVAIMALMPASTYWSINTLAAPYVEGPLIQHGWETYAAFFGIVLLTGYLRAFWSYIK